MNPPQVWVAVATTDRADAFERLCADLTAQAAGAGVGLGLLVVENSRAPAARLADRRTLARLSSWGVRVLVDDERWGDPIDVSRERLRALVRHARSTWPTPRFVWMLDDDVRLLHLVWRDGQVTTEPLHNHIAFLLALSAATPDLDVLIGDVTGDPPIPPIATLASRLGDLTANLRWMFALGPDAPWVERLDALPILAKRDAYYDFSIDSAHPTWTRPMSWLPRERGAPVAQACAEMLAEAGDIPLGIGFTRPILAAPSEFDQLVHGTARGANAVFFDPDACLDHGYPTAEVRGVRSRRSDMVGTRLLAARRPGRVMTSRFSVLHQRPRGGPRPRRDALLTSLVSDTLGSLLARFVDAALVGRGAADVTDARLDRIRGSFRALPGILHELDRLASSAPSWVRAGVVTEIVDWARAEVPGAVDGRLPHEVADAIGAADVRDALRARAVELVAELAAVAA